MGEMAHSKLGASSMYRWSACPGSVELCRDIPSTSSVWAQEGTEAHEYAADFVLGKLPADQFQKLSIEMQEAIKTYAYTIMEDRHGKAFPPKSTGHPDDRLLVEHKFDLSSVFAGCFGTADAVLWKSQSRLLIVYDFKYGSGVAVDVVRNQQMMYYGLGALVTLKFPARFVEIVVVQPRCRHKHGPVRRWRAPSVEFIDFEAELVEAAERTQEVNAPLNPGRHCFFCPAKNSCPARHDQRLEDARSEFSVVEDVDAATNSDDDIFA